MKTIKIFFVLILAFVATTASAQRFGTSAKDDNTGRVVTYGYQTPAYAATLAVNFDKSVNYVKPATLTGAMTINATVTRSKVCDEATFIFTADGTNRVVTFNTNFISASTYTVTASKQATVNFVFDGSKWVEKGNFIQP